MSQAFSAALLAGGRSTRMGQDKAFLEFGDPPQPLWRRQLKLLASLRPAQLLLSHNADQHFKIPHGVEAAVDTRPDCGPLAGLEACLRHAKHVRLLVLAVDLPLISSDFLSGLLQHPGGVVLQDATFGRYEPVVAIYTHDCLPVAGEHLQRGDLAMQHFIAHCVAAGHLEARALTKSEKPLLKNLNRPGDLGG